MLSFYDNKLTTVPNRISDLTNLTELDLSRNSLTQLPLALTALRALRSIDVRWNKLQDVVGSPLTATKCFPELTKLNLSHNELSSLPPAVMWSHPMLAKLHVWMNGRMPSHVSWMYVTNHHLLGVQQLFHEKVSTY
ncbi:MAG: hypothetical protein H0V43_07515 [Gemmatimonadales bacterium]|nr:hypothetical protein [Gemmatimonadales bacterium]